MSQAVHERVIALAGMVDEAKEVLKFAADYSDNGRIDNPEVREAAEAAREILGKLLEKAS
jgi:glycogen debranching enzyme